MVGRKVVLLGCAAIALAWGVLKFGGPMGPDFHEVAHRSNPVVVTVAPKFMLVLEGTGAKPKDVVAAVLPVLFPAFFKYVGGWPPALSGRWWFNGDGSVTGVLGLPVSQGSALALPPGETPVHFSTWEYGASNQVAEILHVGGYDKEAPTIAKLKAFIDNAGFDIVGEHEEEYLRGPGMLFAGDADTYLTVIRYPVQKKQGSPP